MSLGQPSFNNEKTLKHPSSENEAQSVPSGIRALLRFCSNRKCSGLPREAARTGLPGLGTRRGLGRKIIKYSAEQFSYPQHVYTGTLSLVPENSKAGPR